MKLALLAASFALSLAACATQAPGQSAENGVYCAPAYAPGPSHYESNRPRFSPSSGCDGWNRSDRIARDNQNNLGQGAFNEPAGN